MANFFIRRPIVTIVISILTVLLGAVTFKGLSIEQYPFLAPPNIRVTATYPGASAEAVEQSVATPIEQEVNGVDRMIYMKSSNTSDGRMLLDVSFEVGTDQDTANVLTQNRISAAEARLPQEVVQQGVTVKKQSPSILMLISVYSPKDAYDANFLINYCGINLRDHPRVQQSVRRRHERVFEHRADPRASLARDDPDRRRGGGGRRHVRAPPPCGIYPGRGPGGLRCQRPVAPRVLARADK